MLNVDKHLHHVRNALLGAAYQWRDIGRALELTDGTLRSIRGEDNECLNEVLAQWMHSGKATVDQLLDALKDQSVKRVDIVPKILDLKLKEKEGVKWD